MLSKPSKQKIVRLRELVNAQLADFFAQLIEKARGQTRDGKPFYTCKFRDQGRTVSAPIWADSPWFEACQNGWPVGEAFKIRATYSDHNRYGPQIEIEQIRPVLERDGADGFDPLQLEERSRFDSDEMFAQLEALVEQIQDEPLKMLTGSLIRENANILKLLPASERHAYPFPGGWLEHTLNVTRNCLMLAERYTAHFPDLAPPLNRDLILAGAILHDLGRVKDLEIVGPGRPARHAVAGELFGYPYLGGDMIRSLSHGIPNLDPQLLDLLVHVVMAHLRIPEWNSSRSPCIPEVLIVHYADELDSKFEVYYRCLTRDTSDGPFTDHDPALGRALLKDRKV